MSVMRNTHRSEVLLASEMKKFEKLNLKDGAATLSMLTVESICIAINSFKKYPKKNILHDRC